MTTTSTAFESYLQLVVNGTSAVVIFIILVVHCSLFWKDLCSEDRDSIPSGKTKPVKTCRYQTVGVLTTLSVFFACFFLVASISEQLASSTDHCQLGNSLASSIWIYKAFMFGALLLRVDMVYHGTKYSCCQWMTRKFLWFVAFATVTCSFLGLYFSLAIIGAVGDGVSEEEVVVFINEELSINACQYTGISDEIITYLGLFFVLFDGLFNLIYVLLFVIPLRSLTKDIKNSKKDNTRNVEQTLLKVGYKVTVLACVQFLSTFIIVFILGAIFRVDLTGLDALINVICLVLMTPYYPDNKYYFKYCQSCILCCDWMGLSFETVSKNGNDEISLNTFSKVRKAAEENNPSHPIINKECNNCFCRAILCICIIDMLLGSNTQKQAAAVIQPNTPSQQPDTPSKQPESPTK